MTPKQSSFARIFTALVAGLTIFALAAAGSDVPIHSTSDQPPRKVIVGTVLQPFWGKYPGLDKRLAQLTGIIDRMQAQSKRSMAAVWIWRCCRKWP